MTEGAALESIHGSLNRWLREWHCKSHVKLMILAYRSGRGGHVTAPTCRRAAGFCGVQLIPVPRLLRARRASSGDSYATRHSSCGPASRLLHLFMAKKRRMRSIAMPIAITRMIDMIRDLHKGSRRRRALRVAATYSYRKATMGSTREARSRRQVSGERGDQRA